MPPIDFSKISCFVFDVDGVLTDGSIMLLPEGEMVRSMNIKDGYALQLAVKKGLKVVIISGGDSQAIINRFNKLGITDVYMQVHDKKAVLDEYLQKNALTLDELLFMGDDLPDAEVMEMVGLACCPADACQEIQQISHYISPINGGKGCARDVIEKVMKSKNLWQHQNNVSSR